MTRKEFEKLRLSIEGEKYKPLAANPITIGLERAEFEKKRLERLIVAAGTCGAITVQKRLQVYKREIKRVETSLERFAKLREEARDSRPVVEKRCAHISTLPRRSDNCFFVDFPRLRGSFWEVIPVLRL